MKTITERKIRSIIREHIRRILNEKTIRMGALDLVFQGRDRVQLLSRRGRTALTKMDAKIIISAVRKYIGGI